MGIIKWAFRTIDLYVFWIIYEGLEMQSYFDYEKWTCHLNCISSNIYEENNALNVVVIQASGWLINLSIAKWWRQIPLTAHTLMHTETHAISLECSYMCRNCFKFVLIGVSPSSKNDQFKLRPSNLFSQCKNYVNNKHSFNHVSSSHTFSFINNNQMGNTHTSTINDSISIYPCEQNDSLSHGSFQTHTK